MSRLLLVVLICFCQTNNDCFSQAKPFQYTISLDASATMQKLFVRYEIAGINYTDSFVSGKKKIMQTRRLSQPVSAQLSSNSTGFLPVTAFLANNTIYANLEKKSISFSNKQLQRDFDQLIANDRIRPTYFPLYGELVEKNDSIGLRNLSLVFDSLKKDDIEKSYTYFQKNQSSLLSLFAFSRFSSFAADYALVEPDFKLLPEWAKLTPEGKNIRSKITAAQSVKILTQAPQFEQKNINGEILRLKDYQGKYVLLDFWASWCAPCRAEHPDLILAYQQFSRKDFEIIAVSLDNNRNAWLTAIQKDRIGWPNLSDLKGQENELAVKYGVQSIPANFLIDPYGTIIAVNLTGKEVISKLNQLIQQSKTK